MSSADARLAAIEHQVAAMYKLYVYAEAMGDAATAARARAELHEHLDAMLDRVSAVVAEKLGVRSR